jgi:putative YphP/YqiW family bacilliredoxin
MPYPEPLIIPMREDLTKFGVVETRTPEAVDETVATPGTVLMITNSVCGCAAGKARPAIGMALQHTNRPDVAATVFAGADVAATASLREKHLKGIPPSSPSMALFRDGQLVWALHRFEIESRQAPEIAKIMVEAFDRFCTKTTA